MRISLIIPAHNEESYIGETLDAVLKNAPGAFHEIIVVDNASTDKTAEVARQRPGVRVVHEPVKGLPSARQRGLMESTGELVAYIDADSHMHRDWPLMAQKIFTKYPNVVSISGPGRYWDATLWERMVLWFSWHVISFTTYKIVGYMLFGAHFVARRDALLKIGGFDRTIAFYGEDTDIARRLHKVGKVLFRMNFFIYTSARRYKGEGLLRTNVTYALNYFWPVFFHHPLTNTHEDFRDKQPRP